VQIQGNQVGLKLNGARQLLVYADAVTLLGEHKNTTKKNTEALSYASKEFGLEVNTEKTEYMLMSRNQNAGQNYNIKIANISFENVAKLRYLGTTVTNEKSAHEEIKSRFISRNSRYHSVQNLLSSRLLSKNYSAACMDVKRGL
jgi:hypothetical protein